MRFPNLLTVGSIVKHADGRTGVVFDEMGGLLNVYGMDGARWEPTDEAKVVKIGECADMETALAATLQK